VYSLAAHVSRASASPKTSVESMVAMKWRSS
jgi:hypothetical protein